MPVEIQYARQPGEPQPGEPSPVRGRVMSCRASVTRPLTGLGSPDSYDEPKEARSLHPSTIGTCGWSYRDWAGNFYPAGTKPGDYLKFYATQFAIVEVDSTFYRPPSPQMVQNWQQKTPANFRFALKA